MSDVVAISLQVDELARVVIGAGIEVHRSLGPGYLECVYEESLEIELGLRGVGCLRQAPVVVSYKGRPVGEGRLDILVENCLILELKTVETLMPIHQDQRISYLKATDLTLGLLINFNVPVLRDGIKRIAYTKRAP